MYFKTSIYGGVNGSVPTPTQDLEPEPGAGTEIMLILQMFPEG